MGAITGTYVKIMAAKLKLSIQHRIISAQSKLQRVTKEIANMERNLTSQQRSAELAMRNQMQGSIFNFARSSGIDMNNPGSLMNMQQVTLPDGRTVSGSEFMQAFSLTQQQMQYQYAQAQSVWGDYFENIKEAQLEPLKNMESQLTTQIESDKMRLSVAEAQEKTGEQFAQSGIKDLMPHQG